MGIPPDSDPIDITANVPTWDAPGIMAALIIQLGLSTKHNIVTNNLGQGIMTQAVAASETWFGILRQTTLSAIEPSMDTADGGSLDPGNTATPVSGVSADYSYEVGLGGFIPTGSGAGSKLWYFETDDFFGLLLFDVTNTYPIQYLGVGRGNEPEDLSDAAQGCDGLCFVVGELRVSTAAGTGWAYSTTGRSRFHYYTGVWVPAGVETTNPTAASVGPMSAPTKYRIKADHPSGSTYDRIIGSSRYFRRRGLSRLPKVRKEDNTGGTQAWMSVNYANVNDYMVILWKVGVVP